MLLSSPRAATQRLAIASRGLPGERSPVRTRARHNQANTSCLCRDACKRDELVIIPSWAAEGHLLCAAARCPAYTSSVLPRAPEEQPVVY